MTIINQYNNGNYTVTIYNDGTKIRQTDSDEFKPEFAENIDLKITDYCDMCCSMCHEGSTLQGLHADLSHKAFSTFKPGTELAIGGGNPLSHPNLIDFLEYIKNQGVITNLTVHQKHFTEQLELLHYLTSNNLVYGLGVSLLNPNKQFIENIKLFPNSVIHVINGYHSYEQIYRLFGNNLKILILGYKMFRRGKQYFSSVIEQKQKELYLKMLSILKEFKIVSFDNLALTQLNIRRLLTTEEWQKFYMGNDGSFTFYIDAVTQEFAINSTSYTRYPMMDNVTDMFKIIQEQ